MLEWLTTATIVLQYPFEESKFAKSLSSKGVNNESAF